VLIQLGKADAVVTDNALAAGQAAQDPSVELKGSGPFTTEYYGVAAKKGADDLIRRVNRLLVTYRQGPWQQSFDKWLKADMDPDGTANITAPPARYEDG
jgi:polar amino acid transport system substrate-binding protein